MSYCVPMETMLPESQIIKENPLNNQSVYLFNCSGSEAFCQPQYPFSKKQTIFCPDP